MLPLSVTGGEGVLCQNCGRRKAMVNITQIVGNKKTEIHLCQICAQQDGHSDPVFALHKMLTGMVDWEPGTATRPPACPGCGMSEEELRQRGRLGCAKCYETWGSLLDSILNRVHGRTEHRGKVPVSVAEKGESKPRIDQLRHQLTQAVSAERFEDAARLRDEIRSLEQGDGANGTG